MYADCNNLDTAWALRSHVLSQNPTSRMVFGAYSAGKVRWFRAEAQEVKEFETIFIGTRSADRHGTRPADRDFSGVIDVLEEAAGSSSICMISYLGRRNVGWRSATRSQSHLCNGLPGRWDMSNFNQANGRATGDSKELLIKNTGRDHITYLGDKWDHLSDLRSEAWMEEVARRMNLQGMCLKEATDAELHPFPPDCNFTLGRTAHQLRAGKAESKRRFTTEGLLYTMRLTCEDPMEHQLEDQMDEVRQDSNAKKAQSKQQSGITSLTDHAGLSSDLHAFMKTSEQMLLEKARVVSREVIADDGGMLDMYALPANTQLADVMPQLAAVKAGEAEDPVLVTRLEVWTMQQLGLDWTASQVHEEVQKMAKGAILPAALSQVVPGIHNVGVRFCWRHMLVELLKDVRQQEGNR